MAHFLVHSSNCHLHYCSIIQLICRSPLPRIRWSEREKILLQPIFLSIILDPRPSISWSRKSPSVICDKKWTLESRIFSSSNLVFPGPHFTSLHWTCWSTKRFESRAILPCEIKVLTLLDVPKKAHSSAYIRSIHFTVTLTGLTNIVGSFSTTSLWWRDHR